MNTRESLLFQALAVIERDGVAKFSTRAVCILAGVTAPTLYHHFGSADGLLSAAVTRGYDEFLARKVARKPKVDPADDLLDGWDDYVAFAKERPRLYAAMTARFLSGGDIPAAAAATQVLTAKLDALALKGRLIMPTKAATDLVWSTAHAAALLYVSGADPPDAAVVAALRLSAASVLAQSTVQ
jgi:AcrR family transcriptional regulator